MMFSGQQFIKTIHRTGLKVSKGIVHEVCRTNFTITADEALSKAASLELKAGGPDTALEALIRKWNKALEVKGCDIYWFYTHHKPSEKDVQSMIDQVEKLNQRGVA